MPDHNPTPFETLRQSLSGHPDYRLLERARPLPMLRVAPEPERTGLVVDVSTTGRDPGRHEAIRIAALQFTYTVSGAVTASGPAFDGLREPVAAVPADITEITGLTAAMLAGRSLDPDELDQAIGEASLVVAYDAVEVRPFVEPLCERFANLRWGCLRTQVPWAAEGFRPAELGDLLLQHDLFADTRSPSARCEAVLHLLARPLPKSGSTALAPLLEKVRQPCFRLWAVGASARARGLLKSHEYAWNGGADGRPRAWFKDVPPDRLDEEQGFLTSFWFEGEIEPRVDTIDARNRFSDRV